MDKKILRVCAFTTLIIAIAAILTTLGPSNTPQTQQPIEFTVSQTNDCLRFLEREVKLCYTPFHTGPYEQWRLTIECQKMPGSGGWTDIYVYEGYWDMGTDHMCVSEDIYLILSEIPHSEFRVKTDSVFSEVFGESTAKSYTVFFVFPPGGEGTFHVKLDQL